MKPTAPAHPRDRILVALDMPDLDAALAMVAELRGEVGGFKVGLELCTAAGVPRVVESVAAAGGRLFLDLKLKDIPNTVAGAVRALAASLSQHVMLLTLHADGGAAMLRAAAEAAREAHAAPPALIAVTLLTSLDEAALRDELGVGESTEAYVTRMARLARGAGLAGVVASPHEAAAVRAALGPEALIVTPGVRPAWAASGDQRRFMTPGEALRAGADYLVIGRPITSPPPEVGGPAAAARRIAAELAAA